MSVSSLKLVSHTLCPYVQRAIITLHEKQIPYEREYVDLEQKPDWFLALSPMGKVPLLLVNEPVLFESAVICEYLDEVTPGSLHPADPLLKAKHRAWIEFGSSLLNAIAGFYNAKDESLFEAKRQELLQKFQVLESPVTGRLPFLAVITSLWSMPCMVRFFGILWCLSSTKILAFWRDTQGRRWQDTLLNRPSVKEAVLPTYPQLLHEFLLKRHSYLTQMMPVTL